MSADGILEKDVNLVIAKKLKVLLEQEDVCVTMTRDSDTGLYQESDSNKKVADLQNRCALIEKIDPDCTVSIHQNSFSSPEVSGAQNRADWIPPDGTGLPAGLHGFAGRRPAE